MKELLLSLIRLYQRWVSPMTAASCRFEPSCSRYACLCVEHHGAGIGSWLALKRIARCNPLFAPGIDLPPLPADAPAKDREPDWGRLTQLLSIPGPTPRVGPAASPPQKAPARE